VNTFHPRNSVVVLLVLATALLVAPGTAAAKVIREQRNVPSDPSGLMVVSPSRIEQDIQPGVRSTVELTIYNDNDEPIDFSISGTDLGPASSPRSVAAKVEDGEFGAGDWLTPEIRDGRLQPFEAITFQVTVDPPLTAPIGSNLAGISVRGAPALGPVGAGDDTGVLEVNALIQTFLTVPGPVEHKLRIVDIDARDTFVLGSRRFVIWEVMFENRGTVNEHVSGSVNVKSLFGNTAHREKIDDLLVLRGSKRSTRVVWTDLPFVGSFAPEVRVRGDDARLVTQTGERVTLMPWWLPPLIIALFVLPVIWMWWRRRQEWKLYLEDDEYGEQEWEDDVVVEDH
jgi:hypothetical protein